jgi:hypothetical protein
VATLDGLAQDRCDSGRQVDAMNLDGQVGWQEVVGGGGCVAELMLGSADEVGEVEPGSAVGQRAG